MVSNWWQPLIPKWSRTSRTARRPKRPARARLHIELLENREVPALVTLHWTGGFSGAWNDARNWTENALPATGAILDFPASAQHMTGQTVGFTSTPQFDGIIYEGGGYSVNAGGTINLEIGNIQLTGTGTDTIGANINFSSGVSATISAAAGGELDLNGVVSGSVGLLLPGSGTVALGGSNTYSGSTTVQAGVLQAKNDNALGTPASGAATATQVNPGATLQLFGNVHGGNGGITVPATESLTLNGTLLSGGSDGSTWAGPIHVGGSATIQKDLGGGLFLTGAIDGNGDLAITHETTDQGGGIVIFKGNNSAYQGRINVSQTTLIVNNANALGTTTTSTGAPADTIFQDRGRLLLDTRAGSFTLAEPLTLSGAGPTGATGDALSLEGGTAPATLSGPIQLAGDTTITGAGLTISGPISTAASVPASATTNLTIAGGSNGTFTLEGPAANTYRGTTTSQIGTLKLNKGVTIVGIVHGVTAIPGDLIITGGNVVLGGILGNADNEIASSANVTVDNGLLNLNGNDDTIRTLTLKNGGDVSTGNGILTVTGDVTVDAASGASTISGNLNLVGVRTFTVNGTTNPFTVSAVVTGSSTGGITKAGTGTMVLSANNSNYAGTTVVTQGTLKISNANALGTPGGTNSDNSGTVGGTTVQTGATLAVTGPSGLLPGSINDISVGEALLLAGGTLAGVSDGATHTWTGPLAINTSGTVSQGPSGITVLNSATTCCPANAVLTKDGSGTVRLNAHTGNVTGNLAFNVIRGTLELNAAGGGSLGNGDTLTIGQDPVNNVVVPATVLLDSDGQIDGSVPVTIKNGGTLDLNNHSDAIGPLTMDGGATVSTGTGTVTVGAGGITVQNTGVPATINGNLSMMRDGVGNGDFPITVADGAAAHDLIINAVIHGGVDNTTPIGTQLTTTTNLVKKGPGDLQLAAANTYAGQTKINEGSVTIMNIGALSDTLNGTTVASGATLHLAAGGTLAEPLNLSGPGVGGLGALQATGGVSAVGPVTLQTSDVAVGVAPAGTLTLGGQVTGSGGLNKLDGGTLILSEPTIEGVRQTNTYAGATTVSAGMLVITTPTALGTPTAPAVDPGTTVLSGTTLAITGGITVSTEPLTLNGTGIPVFEATTGALQSGAGGFPLTSNSWLGPITLNTSDATVNSLGPLLTLGTLVGPGGLTVAGGTVELAGSTDNQYAGLTTVADNSTLKLNKNASGGGHKIAVPHDLVIGDLAIGANLAQAIVAAPEQIPDTARVTVGPVSSLVVNADETIGPLTLASGGTSGTGRLFLNGDLTATGDQGHGQPGLGGTIVLNGASRTFTVGDAINPNTVLSVVNGATLLGTAPLTKDGPGIFSPGTQNSYTSPITVNAGVLNLGGTLASPVAVNSGATLVGKGTVGSLTVAGGGTVAPAGTVTVTSGLTFASGSTLSVDLNGTGAGQFDQVVVNGGTVSLGDAQGNPLLTGTASSALSGIPVFTILDNRGTAAVGGKFDAIDPTTGQRHVFDVVPPNNRGKIGNSSFSISYTANDGNDVRLTLEGASALEDRSITTPISEGGVATLKGTILDTDPNGIFVLRVTWGDGTPTETFTFPPSAPRAVSLQHRYATAGQFTAHLEWQDVNGPPTTADLAVAVTAVAPVVDAGGDATVRPGGVLSRSGSFSDPGADTWTATVDYGDRTGVQPLRLDGQTFRLQHRYKKAGKFHVTVTVRDDAGLVGTDRFVVNVTTKPQRLHGSRHAGRR
jgi:autotransporter-associated beta strand protein